jgi:hypothetical protein
MMEPLLLHWRCADDRMVCGSRWPSRSQRQIDRDATACARRGAASQARLRTGTATPEQQPSRGRASSLLVTPSWFATSSQSLASDRKPTRKRLNTSRPPRVGLVSAPYGQHDVNRRACRSAATRPRRFAERSNDARPESAPRHRAPRRTAVLRTFLGERSRARTYVGTNVSPAEAACTTCSPARRRLLTNPNVIVAGEGGWGRAPPSRPYTARSTFDAGRDADLRARHRPRGGIGVPGVELQPGGRRESTPDAGPAAGSQRPEELARRRASCRRARGQALLATCSRSRRLAGPSSSLLTHRAVRTDASCAP